MRLPVLLQGVDANVSGLPNVGVVDAGQEEGARRGVGELRGDAELEAEDPPLVRRPVRPLDIGVNLFVGVLLGDGTVSLLLSYVRA